MTQFSAPSFSVSRVGVEGYDANQVDEFVQRLNEALSHHPPTMAPWEVREQLFGTGRFHRCYDYAEVDAYLDDAESKLTKAHGILEYAAGPSETEPAPRRWWAVAGPLTLVVLFLIFLVLIG